MFSIKCRLSLACFCLYVGACSGGHGDGDNHAPVPTAGNLSPQPSLPGRVEVGAGHAGATRATGVAALAIQPSGVASPALLALPAVLVDQTGLANAAAPLGIDDMEKIGDSIPGDTRIAALSAADPAAILGRSAPNPHQPRDNAAAMRVKNVTGRPFATGKWSKGFFYQSPTRLDAWFQPSEDPADPRNLNDSSNNSIFAFPNKLWLDDRIGMVSIAFPKNRYIALERDPDSPLYDLTNPYFADMVLFTMTPDADQDMRLTYLPDGVGRLVRQIDRFDELTVTTSWKNPSGERAMQVIAAEGSPYVTLRYRGLRPLVQVGKTLQAARLYDANGAPVSGSLRRDDWENGNQIVAVATDENPLIKFQEFGATPSRPSLSGTKFRFVYAAADQSSAPTGSNDRQIVAPVEMYKEAIVYTSAPLTLEWHAARRSYVASAPFDGVLRTAFVGGIPQAAVADPLAVSDLASFGARRSILDQHSQTYALSSEVRLEYDGGATASVSYQWLAQRMDGATPAQSELMMMAFDASQLPSLGTPQTAPLSYPSNFGRMSAVLGTAWRQTIAMPAMLRKGASEEQLWFGPRPFKKDDSPALQESLVADMALLKGYIQHCNYESYLCGKYLNNIARLILIADRLGEPMASTKLELLSFLKQTLQPWFDGIDPNDPANPGSPPTDYFLYDSTNGGIISERGRKAWNDDFYNGIYIDHMFHYGYFIFASAVLGRYDSAWLAANREKVTTLVRDIANPSADDSYFPVLRTYDWFRMQNFADSGPAFNGPNTESSSESINANYALMLWGVLTGNTEFQALAAVMTAAEIRNARAYYQLTPQNNPFKDVPVPVVTVKTTAGPAQVALDPGRKITTGIVFQDITQWQIFFGPLEQYLTGIQVLPISAISSEVLSDTWAKAHAEELRALEQRQTDLFNAVVNVPPNDQSPCYRAIGGENVGATCAAQLQILYSWRGVIASANGLNAPVETYARYRGYMNALKDQEALYQANTDRRVYPGSSLNDGGVVADVLKTVATPSVDTNVLWWLSTLKP